MLTARYDVVDLKYSDGSPAVLRHVDGSGFAYYQSGRKAICISAHGGDAKGRPRRFSAVLHRDANRSPVAGVFDEWGRGYADGLPSGSENQPPKVLITEKGVTIIDGTGKATEVPHGVGTAAPAGGSPDIVLRVSEAVTLSHRKGRTALDFRCGGIDHTFCLGERQGEEVPGMPPRGADSARPNFAEETMRQLAEFTETLDKVREKVSSLRVDPSQKDTKLASTLNTASLATASFKDVLDNLSTFSQSLAHPNLAPPNLEWSTEGRLRKLLAASHPQLPGQRDAKNWSISRVSGKCTEERLANTKPTVTTPKTLTLISQLKVSELVEECASKGTLLVVICLAAYAQEQSNYAKKIAEGAHAEFWRSLAPGEVPPVRLVAVELTEVGTLSTQYGPIKEVPYCLMFQGGHLVHSKRLRGMRLEMGAREISCQGVHASWPRVLLLEENPGAQLKLERSLRRIGYSSDLALDGAQALQLTSRQLAAYGVLLASAQLRTEQLRATAAAVRRLEPRALILAFNASLPAKEPGEEPEARKQFLERDCTFLFPHIPSYTSLAAVLARFEVSSKLPRSDKQDFLDEVQAVMRSHGLAAGSMGEPRPGQS
jgi:hypothetical protein